MKHAGSFIVLLYVYQRVSEVFDFDMEKKRVRRCFPLGPWPCAAQLRLSTEGEVLLFGGLWPPGGVGILSCGRRFFFGGFSGSANP